MGDDEDSGDGGGMVRRLWLTIAVVGGGLGVLFGLAITLTADLAEDKAAGLFIAAGAALVAWLVYRWGLWLARGK